MDDLEKKSLTGLTVNNVNEETSEKLTCRQKTIKYAIKGNVICIFHLVVKKDSFLA